MLCLSGTILWIYTSIHHLEKLCKTIFFYWRSGTCCNKMTGFVMKWMHIQCNFLTLRIKWRNFCKRSFLLGAQELVLTKWMLDIFYWYNFLTQYIKWRNFFKRWFVIGGHELVVTKWQHLWQNDWAWNQSVTPLSSYLPFINIFLKSKFEVRF